MARIALYGMFGLFAFGGVFLFIATPNTFVVAPEAPVADPKISVIQSESSSSSFGVLLPLPEAPLIALRELDTPRNGNGDSSPQHRLPNPPGIVKAIYLTGWSAGTPSRVERSIALVKRTELNAVVIDIKDYSGYVSYLMDVPLVHEIGADREIRIVRPNALVKKLHDNGIYVIGRITVFQDPILAKAKPEWALQDSVTGDIWKDRKGLGWMDPKAKPVWDYTREIAKDALARGFDEINFDYIRFASDGDLSRAKYPFWNGTTSKHGAIREFFAYLRTSLPDAKISADLFGLSTVNKDDLGIGQVLEDAYEYFDFVSPMVYPSHYANGFIGLQNPGAYPYEVMKYSLDQARKRREAFVFSLASTTKISLAEASRKVGTLRPWIQDFDLGAEYTPEMVRKEFKAVYDALGVSSSSTNPARAESYGGWYIWDPSNAYTEQALEPEQ